MAELEAELGAQEKFFATTTSGDFVVRFDKILGKPGLSIYNIFEISTKRNFRNELDHILETYEEIFIDEDTGTLNEAGEWFILHLLNAKVDMMEAKTMSFDGAFELIDKIIESKNSVLTNRIAEFVEDNYIDMTTTDTEKYKKNNDLKQLVITNDLAKKICEVAYMHRLLIPVIADYLVLSGAQNDDVELDENEDNSNMSLKNEDICNKMFDHIIDKCSTQPKRIKNKLYKLVESRVNKYNFSATAFWEKASDYTVSPASFIENIYKKVLNSAIHKMNMLEEDFNIVSYLQSIINNQIAFKFGMKFNDTYTYYNPSNGSYQVSRKDDNKDLTLDKIEAQLATVDEGNLIIEQCNKNIVDIIPKIFGVSAEDIEVQTALNYIKINPVQEQIVSLLTYKYFDSVDTIKTMSTYEYAKVLLCCSKYLAKNNFVILSKILMSNCYAHIEKISITGNKIKSKIQSTKEYQALIRNKYASYQNEIEKPLESLIATIRSSQFVDSDNNDIFEEGISLEEVANEVCQLVNLF